MQENVVYAKSPLSEVGKGEILPYSSFERLTGMGFVIYFFLGGEGAEDR